MKYTNIGKHSSLNNSYSTTSANSNSVNKSAKSSKSRYILIGSVLLVFGLLIVFKDSLKTLFDPVSIVTNAATSGLNDTDGRINVLLLGSDKRKANKDSYELTDTILVASIGVVEGNITMISLPRDLWVDFNHYEGYTARGKINSVYANGGAESLSTVIETVLGLPIHYYAVINFEIFKEAIDTVGGIEVDVENAFTDKSYPVPGKEADPNFEARYETLVFKAGPQVMDGDTALKYVRSRMGDNNEGTDFARSRRQQKVIAAIKNKALSFETLIDVNKLTELYNTYSKNIDTNIDLKAANGFYFLAQNIDFQNMKSIVLDDRSAANEGGLLYHPEDNSLYGGQYVLIPKSGDFNQLHAYVQRYIFGAE